MSNKAVLGMDTSNYTTSIALVDLKGNILYDGRMLLPVNKGERGLRQSDALFHHIKNLPVLAEEARRKIGANHIVAISSSTKPRPVEDSYMPVFLGSQSFGETMANLWKVPFFKFSHQEGHIEAGLLAEGLSFEEDFIALHISGGTTEILMVKPKGLGYDIEILGGSSDISAGQLIDRVGTKIGLPFPAGSHLEKLSQGIEKVDFKIPVSIAGNMVSFSGPETHFSRLVDDGTIDPGEIAYGTFLCVAKSLVSLIKNILKEYTAKNILIVGGVASNGLIRSYLRDKLGENGLALHFAQPKYCTDNAIGIASLGLSQYLKENPII